MSVTIHTVHFALPSLILALHELNTSSPAFSAHLVIDPFPRKFNTWCNRCSMWILQCARTFTQQFEELEGSKERGEGCLMRPGDW